MPFDPDLVSILPKVLCKKLTLQSSPKKKKRHVSGFCVSRDEDTGSEVMTDQVRRLDYLVGRPGKGFARSTL